MLQREIPIHYVVALGSLFGKQRVTGHRSKVDGVENQVGKRTLRKTTHRPAYIEWRSLRCFGRPYPGEWQSVVDAEAATKCGLGVPEHVIGKADTRFEIAQGRIAGEEVRQPVCQERLQVRKANPTVRPSQAEFVVLDFFEREPKSKRMVTSGEKSVIVNLIRVLNVIEERVSPNSYAIGYHTGGNHSLRF